MSLVIQLDYTVVLVNLSVMLAGPRGNLGCHSVEVYILQSMNAEASNQGFLHSSGSGLSVEIEREENCNGQGTCFKAKG